MLRLLVLCFLLLLATPALAQVDADGDGFPEDVDCNDSNPDQHPGATEVLGDGIDSNCDGQEICYVDADQDGYGVISQSVISDDTDCLDPGEATLSSVLDPEDRDCWDDNPDVHPGAPEIPGNGIDDDCDGVEDPVAVEPGRWGTIKSRF